MRALRHSGLTLAAVVALGIGGGTLIGSEAFAAPQNLTIDGITYGADDTDIAAGATVTDFDGSSTAVVIRNSVEIGGFTYSVVEIDPEVFLDSGLTSVTIGSNIKKIGDKAFMTNDLGSVTIPNSVTDIGEAAFANNDLTSLTLGNSVKTIGDAAFSGHPKSLTTVVIPSSVTSIGRSAFINNYGLTSVIFEGAPPIVTSADSYRRSFETLGEPLVLSYQWAFDAANVTNGFTEPMWKGYDTLALNAPEPDPALTITKTVDASYVRVHNWDLEKVGTISEITKGDDSYSAEVDYVVTAKPLDYVDSYHVLKGTITVTNPYVEPVMIDEITDVPSVVADAACDVYDDDDITPVVDVSLGASASLTFEYYCIGVGIPENGTNTATVAWSGGGFGDGNTDSVTENVKFTQRDTNFKHITVGDNKGDFTAGFVDLGEAHWSADRFNYEFSYTQTFSGLSYDECTTVSNRAIIYDTEQTVDASVELCADAVIVPTEPPVVPPVDPPANQPQPKAPTKIETASPGMENVSTASATDPVALTISGAALAMLAGLMLMASKAKTRRSH